MGSSKDLKKLIEQFKKLIEENQAVKEQLAAQGVTIDNIEDKLKNSTDAQINKLREDYDKISEGGIIIVDNPIPPIVVEPPPVVTPPPTQGGGEKDQYGITKIYADKPNGVLISDKQFVEEEFTRNYASGAPSENSYECEYKDSNKLENEEVTFYVKINGFKKERDTISVKLLGNKHSDGSKDKWLIFQLDTDGTSGENFQIEDPHPKNTDNHQKTLFEVGSTLINAAVGFKAITYIDPDNKRHAETWLDFPTDIDNPANNWRKYIDIPDVVKDCEKGFLNATNGGALLRIDGTKKGLKPTTKYMSIREIAPGEGGPTIPPVIPPTPPTEPPVVTPPTTEGVIYDSNTDGGWSNGTARTVTKTDGNITPNGKGLECRASGDPTLIIDGMGASILQCQPGHGRIYIYCTNYSGILEEEVMFDANVENHTIQTRSRHNEAPDNNPENTYWDGNNFGGLSAKVSPVDVGLKMEKFHNEHLADVEKPLSPKLELNKWHKIKYTFNDTADGKGIYQKLEVNGKEVISQTVTSGIEPYFQDKAKFAENSYIWLRQNNTKPAKLGIKNVKLTAL